MQDAVSHQWEFVRREEISDGAVLQKLFQNYHHFVSLFVVVFYREWEEGFGEGMLGDVHNVIEGGKTLLDQLGIVDV